MEIPNYRIGNGVDVHPLVKGRKLILGGVYLNHSYGCDGHSDGDVLVHSIIDAILGALNKGDIGSHFPSSDNSYKDISSLELLSDIAGKYAFSIINIDSTIILQEPIIEPYISDMKKNIFQALRAGVIEWLKVNYPELDVNQELERLGWESFNKRSKAKDISIKATTTDKLGFIGNKEGIATITTCLIVKHD